MIKKIYNYIKKFLGIKLKKHMEIAQRVQAKVNELNSQEPRALFPLAQTPALPWSAVPGYFALTGFDNSRGVPAFNANYGYIVKIFVNSRTGEMKIYPYNLFDNG